MNGHVGRLKNQDISIGWLICYCLTCAAPVELISNNHQLLDLREAFHLLSDPPLHTQSSFLFVYWSCGLHCPCTNRAVSSSPLYLHGPLSAKSPIAPDADIHPDKIFNVMRLQQVIRTDRERYSPTGYVEYPFRISHQLLSQVH